MILSPAPASASAIGAQPSDADLTAIAALATTAFGRALLTNADAAALLAAAGGQAASSDLAAIDALTTTAYGRSVLALADQAALVALLPGYQPADAELATLAAATLGATGLALLAAATASAGRDVLGATGGVFPMAAGGLGFNPTGGTEGFSVKVVGGVLALALGATGSINAVESPSWTEPMGEATAVSLNEPTVVESLTWSA